MNQAPHSEMPPMRSNWPTTLGIISIIMGGFGFLAAASQIANFLMMQSLGSSFFAAGITTSSGASPEQKAIEEAMTEATGKMMTDLAEFAKGKIFADVAMLTLAVVLFGGGILLLQRKRISKPILVGWSYAKLVLGLYSVMQTRKLFSVMGNTMGAAINEEMFNASGGSSGAPPFDMVKMYEMMGLASMVIGAVWVAILPILLMIWFNRAEIKHDMIHGYGWN